jgi:hypothetical protein
MPAKAIAQLLAQAAEAPASTIFLPGGMGDIVTTVEAVFERTFTETPRGLNAYITTVDYLWPSLRLRDQDAFMLLVCEVYLQIAERVGFTVDVEQLRGGYDDSSRLYRYTGRDDSKTARCG